MTYDVLGLGAVAWDEILTVDAYPEADAKVRIQGRRHQCGGLTGNALIAAARFGARCGYAGRLGTDPASQQVADAFRAEGISLEHAIQRPEHRVVQSTIIVATQTGTRNVFSLSPGGTGADEALPDPEILRGVRVLGVDHHGIAGSIRAARLVREAGGSVVSDFERADDPRFPELLALVNHLVCSEPFALRWTEAGSPPEAARRLWTPDRQVVVVTCGAAGGWFFMGSGEPQHFPTPEIHPVDSNGCGDVFHGVYAATLAAGHPLAERLKLAATAAALKATRPSGPDAIPRRGEVEDWLRAQP